MTARIRVDDEFGRTALDHGDRPIEPHQFAASLGQFYECSVGERRATVECPGPCDEAFELS